MTPARRSPPLAEEPTMWPRVLRRTRRRSAIMVSGAAAPSRGGVNLRRPSDRSYLEVFSSFAIERASQHAIAKGGDT